MLCKVTSLAVVQVVQWRPTHNGLEQQPRNPLMMMIERLHPIKQ